MCKAVHQCLGRCLYSLSAVSQSCFKSKNIMLGTGSDRTMAEYERFAGCIQPRSLLNQQLDSDGVERHLTRIAAEMTNDLNGLVSRLGLKPRHMNDIVKMKSIPADQRYAMAMYHKMYSLCKFHTLQTNYLRQKRCWKIKNVHYYNQSW